MRFNILVVEDDPNTSSLVRQVLQDEGGFNVQVCDKIGDAKREAGRVSFDCFIVDRNLPDGDGLDFCMEIRKKRNTKKLPLLFLTAKNSVNDKVQALRSGGDDYMTKPFDSAELLARIDALLRRSGRIGQPEVLEAEDLRLELESRKTFVQGKPVQLWAKEFDLLTLLMNQRGRVLSRDFLLQEIWGYSPDANPSTKVVDVTVSHLRNKLGPLADKVATVRGFGYRLDL